MTELTEKSTMVRLIQLDELLERLRYAEMPGDVEILGQKFPPLPLADARFFAARRAAIWERKEMLLRADGRTFEADAARDEKLRYREVYQGLVSP